MIVLELTIPQLKKLRLLKSWHNGEIARALHVYLFFLAFPFISIGNSLSFYVFLYLLVLLNRKREHTIIGFAHPKTWLLGVFGAVAIGSTIFSPLNNSPETMQTALKLSLQVLYWISIVMFIQTHGPKMNFCLVCKYLTIGTWIVVAQFFFFNFVGDLPLILTGSRNSVVFTILALTPFHAYYFEKRLGSKFLLLYLIFCIMVMLATEGRAGAVLMLLESLLIGSILVHQRLKIVAKLMFMALLGLFLLLYNEENSAILANNVRQISPRVAEFIEGRGQAGNLTKDESWLTRRLMIEKGKEIIEKHPLYGVGLMNFSFYEAKLTSLWQKEYAPLQDEVNPSKHFNKASAHNSYLQIWAETGYIGLISLLLFLAFPLAFFFRKFIFGSLGLEDLPLISLCCVCLHFYVISIITSALSWLVFGFAYAAYRRRLVV